MKFFVCLRYLNFESYEGSFCFERLPPKRHKKSSMNHVKNVNKKNAKMLSFPSMADLCSHSTGGGSSKHNCSF